MTRQQHCHVCGKPNQALSLCDRWGCKEQPMSTPDFSIEYHGTITLVRPLTDLCHMWIGTNVATEGWQWFGGALAVEPRYLDALVQGLEEAGFTHQEEG